MLPRIEDKRKSHKVLGTKFKDFKKIYKKVETFIVEDYELGKNPQ